VSKVGVPDQNVELHRRVLAAVNARDLEAVIALCDPDIELQSTDGWAAGGPLLVACALVGRRQAGAGCTVKAQSTDSPFGHSG
jgi:hypothetical protein